jgi:lambda repressor-like predicted transcriptional regulator
MYARKLPLSPLLDLVDPHRVMTGAEIARRLNIPAKRFQHITKANEVTWLQGDRIAIGMGMHPVMIWPREWCEPIKEPNSQRRVNHV